LWEHDIMCRCGSNWHSIGIFVGYLVGRKLGVDISRADDDRAQSRGSLSGELRERDVLRCGRRRFRNILRIRRLLGRYSHGKFLDVDHTDSSSRRRHCGFFYFGELRRGDFVQRRRD
jgi:hypothetical protein